MDCEYCKTALDDATTRLVEVTKEEALISELHTACPECASAYETVYRWE